MPAKLSYKMKAIIYVEKIILGGVLEQSVQMRGTHKMKILEWENFTDIFYPV